ncbi:Heat shock factor binding 1 [Macleaya cordata]|uniref:Heat shock factor binding 1 n=1 Tax=Macleaya cordata TaxID=56857 RepID=A0A200RBJ3_MACCD|nr:Heat shock factor binding 1 [Macleaya cordata]
MVPADVQHHCCKEYPFSCISCRVPILLLVPIARDEMGSRIDELEQSINELRADMGVEGSSPLGPSKIKSEEAKSADGSA